MSQSRRTSDTLAVSIAILVLFAITQLWGEPAAGATTPVHSERMLASIDGRPADPELLRSMANALAPG